MAEPVTIVQAAALFNISGPYVADLCRSGKLRSARKEKPPFGGQKCWVLDPSELDGVLGGRPSLGELPEPWSPRYRAAPPGEPTDLQFEVLAGEWWHDLVNMDLREDGDLWTRWSDGERFIIHPNGELDQFRYERTDAEHRQTEREQNATVAG